MELAFVIKSRYKQSNQNIRFQLSMVLVLSSFYQEEEYYSGRDI